MQIGKCPYDDCDDEQMRMLPDGPLPVLGKEECPGCSRTIWVYYSRVEPQAFTQEDFEKVFTITDDRKVTRKAKAA